MVDKANQVHEEEYESRQFSQVLRAYRGSVRMMDRKVSKGAIKHGSMGGSVSGLSLLGMVKDETNPYKIREGKKLLEGETHESKVSSKKSIIKRY